MQKVCPKLAPKNPQDPAGTLPKPLKSRSGASMRGMMRPRAPQEHPKGTPETPKRRPRAADRRPRVPKRPPRHTPKSPPTLQNRARRASRQLWHATFAISLVRKTPKSIFGSFWTVCAEWPTCVSYWFLQYETPVEHFSQYLWASSEKP